MKTLLPKILLFLFLFSTSNVDAQSANEWVKGYYLDFEGQKTEGYFMPSGQKIDYMKFKKNLGVKVSTHLTPSQAKFFSDDESHYYQSEEVNIRGEIQVLFLKKLIKGKISLFRAYDGGGLRHYLVNRLDKDSIILVPSKVALPFLEVYLAECKSILPERLVYNYNTLQSIVIKGNECLGAETPVIFEEKQLRNKFSYGVGAIGRLGSGRTYMYNVLVGTNLRTRSSAITDDISIGGGALLHLNWGQLLELDLGIQVSSIKTKNFELPPIRFGRTIDEPLAGWITPIGNQIHLLNAATITNRVNLLEVPLMFKFYLKRNGRINPFVGMGYTVRKVISSNISRAYEGITLDKNLRFDDLELPNSDFENISSDVVSGSNGVTFSVGARLHFKDSRHFFHAAINYSTLEYQVVSKSSSFDYVDRDFLGRFDDFTFEQHSVSLMVGYSYYFSDNDRVGR